MNQAPDPPHAGVKEQLVLSENELRAWGRTLGARLSTPCAIALSGDLGAGKTALVRAICEGYGVTQPVTSPTFALIHRYESPRGPVFHIDLYRLTTGRQVAELGLAELLDENPLVLIEWPERAAGILPADAMRIRLEHIAPDTSRRAIFVE